MINIPLSCTASPDCTKCKISQSHLDAEMPNLHLYDESRRASSDVRLEEERRRNSFRERPTGHKSDAALPQQAVSLMNDPHGSL